MDGGDLLKKLETLSKNHLDAGRLKAEIEELGETVSGDMPGDKIVIGSELVVKAVTLIPLLLDRVSELLKRNKTNRAVIGLCGGSGSGKSGTGVLLTGFFNKHGVDTYMMSGDNYPRRIPEYNDAERLRLFRQGGVRGLVLSGELNPERLARLQEFQEKNSDADPGHILDDPWMETYLKGGRVALSSYLGGPDEIDYKEVEHILWQFKSGAEDVWMRRMGRDMTAFWYEKVHFQKDGLLILEWTHANSNYFQGVDLPVLLNSTPEETVTYRLRRARDGQADHPFVSMVLQIEQEKQVSLARKAVVILSRQGQRITYDEYVKLNQA